MKAPVVAIVGRPNVGKSSLLNALARKRLSIVEPTAGVTRDRVTALIEYDAYRFEAIDTGGLGIVDAHQLEAHIENQIRLAFADADALIFVLDAREGVHPLDEHAARALRKLGKPVVVAVNKAETEVLAATAQEAHRLGFQDVIAISAQQRQGLREMIEALAAGLDAAGCPMRVCGASDVAADEGAAGDEALKVAIVGKRNAGKSTLVNRLAGAERVIVSDTPGTTRDAVDVRLAHQGRAVVLIDTAGMRKRKALESSIEFYAQARTERAVRRADVVALLLDCETTISQVDKRLFALIEDEARPLILAVNKWDRAGAQSVTSADFLPYLEQQLPACAFAPVLFLSGREGQNVERLLPLAFDLDRQAGLRVPTGEFNRALEDSVARKMPRAKPAKKPKVYYGAQVEVRPPTFVITVNDTRLFDRQYARYLANRLRERFDFKEVPLRVFFRSRDGA